MKHREINKYNVGVVIRNGEYEEKQLLYTASFLYNSELRGKRTYLSIEPEDPDHADYSYDLRFDEDYDHDLQMTFLTLWAENHWTGENGSWKLIGITITSIDEWDKEGE